VAFRHLSPSRSHFVTHHLVDLAVVVLPVLRPLRALRLLRLFTLSRAAVVLINALTRVRGILTHRHRDHGGLRRQLPGHHRRPVRGRGARQIRLNGCIPAA
jgi:hypothetical protein